MPDNAANEWRRKHKNSPPGFIPAGYFIGDTAFVQCKPLDSKGEKNTTLESVMLDLLGGDPSGKIPDKSGLPAGSNRVAFGTMCQKRYFPGSLAAHKRLAIKGIPIRI